MPAASMDVIFNMHQFFVLVSLFCPIKKASALMFLLSNYTDISMKGVFQWDKYRNELSSGLFWHSFFTSNFDAEYKSCLRTVNSAMKADIVREKKPGIMVLYPEGNAILQDYNATIHRSHVKLLKQFSWFCLDSASQMG